MDEGSPERHANTQAHPPLSTRAAVVLQPSTPGAVLAFISLTAIYTAFRADPCGAVKLLAQKSRAQSCAVGSSLRARDMDAGPGVGHVPGMERAMAYSRALI
jgi:hypothetical protein